jgi:hypothetical protein
MAERQDMLREAETEAARERAMVDEVVRRIQEEDAANVALRKQKQVGAVGGSGTECMAVGWGVQLLSQAHGYMATQAGATLLDVGSRGSPVPA